ncbi:protein of unknown function [Methylocella tundrae]|uniref:Uncharacterized protein n=1 Tax=Methylocella tundrae TaxID=227605 RepID=A0A4U8YXU3_METTU|nr:protein of unknown function [Methylocella tundrae]
MFRSDCFMLIEGDVLTLLNLQEHPVDRMVSSVRGAQGMAPQGVAPKSGNRFSGHIMLEPIDERRIWEVGSNHGAAGASKAIRSGPRNRPGFGLDRCDDSAVRPTHARDHARCIDSSDPCSAFAPSPAVLLSHSSRWLRARTR